MKRYAPHLLAVVIALVWGLAGYLSGEAKGKGWRGAVIGQERAARCERLRGTAL